VVEKDWLSSEMSQELVDEQKEVREDGVGVQKESLLGQGTRLQLMSGLPHGGVPDSQYNALNTAGVTMTRALEAMLLMRTEIRPSCADQETKDQFHQTLLKAKAVACEIRGIIENHPRAISR
jgi:hypothetical protein